ncbi:hypothetical protein [Micromonospora schwarzwaldensis]
MTDPYTPPPAQPPTQPLTFASPPAPGGKRRNPLVWIAGGLGVLVLLCCGAGAIGAALDDSKPAAQTSPSVSTPTATATAAPTTAVPPTVAPATPAAAASSKPAPTRTTPPAKPKPVVYGKLTERQWKLIAKNPDSYTGRTYVVYGQVTQFDAATGTDAFRANVGGRNLTYEFEYDTNTLLQGDAGRLSDLVQDDEFQAKVTVLGSFSYDTQIGGETTVPLLRVDSIKVL